LPTLRQIMKVPNVFGLSPNNGLEILGDQSMASNPHKGQAECLGAKTTRHAVMTPVCHHSFLHPCVSLLGGTSVHFCEKPC